VVAATILPFHDPGWFYRSNDQVSTTEDQMRQCTTCAGKSCGAFLCRFRRSMLAEPGVRAPKNNNLETLCTVSALYPAGQFHQSVSLFLSFNLSSSNFRIGAKTNQPLLANLGKKPLITNFCGRVLRSQESVISVAVILRSNANWTQVHWRLPIWLCEKIVAWVGAMNPNRTRPSFWHTRSLNKRHY
jgi:hypothetical protein